MNITLNSIQTSLAMGVLTFAAIVLVNGTPAFSVSDNGVSLSYSPIGDSEQEINSSREMIESVSQWASTLTDGNGSAMTIDDVIHRVFDQNQIASHLEDNFKKSVLYINEGQLLSVTPEDGDTVEDVINMVQEFFSDAVILNTMPAQQAAEILVDRPEELSA